MDDEINADNEELAPMVDGLSGALCILILVSSVFMLSSSDLLVESDGGAFKIRDSYVEFDKKTIHYEAVVSLSATDLYQLRKHFIDSGKKKIVLYGAVASSVKSFREKNTYNLLKAYADLKLPSNIEVMFKVGDISLCDKSTSCIYWGFD
ncbi:hypothetical protein A9798_01675 [Edwardsiella hoshinae]|uniref:Uncharacterized protein n=1 Tax=Edwardsiella hoshinae TaxID=93378 RepID=A0ABN4SUA7_9GAMM|nr:hypothetical protein [Edwardsiella hoshinae]AOV95780.1 hypothetical protein A9798_01675 [Edwardsiella hoshinae]